jgi:DNA helicase-2/ATP-dependent DNA helicase PcrA
MSKISINQTKQEEYEYLEYIKQRLQLAIHNTETSVAEHAREVQETKDYLWENKAGMDHVEKVSVRESITQIAITGENAVAKKKRLAKLKNSPYFGRIDFSEKGMETTNHLYIGIHSFFDQEKNLNIIHDWRAPISSMFYDFELGEVFFEAPTGKIEGEISLKRQFRIRQGKMEFMLESSLNIHDDILQKELSQNSSDKMKTIVATIQRDQNAIIRNENSKALIIQGVAGSGKTSIALHRIAFLLYRFKETIKSEDILIISPNKVFGDYISNVLPELGEEKIQETSMEDLADEMLEYKYKFQSFFEQVSQLLENKDEAFKERIRFKSGFGFISKLNDFLVFVENEFFIPSDVFVKKIPVPSSYIAEKYKSYSRVPILKRIAEIVNDIVNDLNFYNHYQVSTAERNQLRKDVEKMFKTLNLRKFYLEFYQWMGMPEMLKMLKGSTYEYADVFPLIYLKLNLEGAKTYQKVKHLVVDEMQDYTPLQYSILARLFPCNKTILGDSNQSVNPYSSSNSDIISQVFQHADCMKMLKSYRSTVEIVEFAQKIRNNPDLEVIERHGQKPQIKYCETEENEISEISQIVAEFIKSKNKSMGIICKTQLQADMLYQRIKKLYNQMHVLNSQSASFSNGIIISTAHMAKGLEFDHVIIPQCNAGNYNSETDKQMFYVACTRAMHQLNMTYTGIPTDFIIY